MAEEGEGSKSHTVTENVQKKINSPKNVPEITHIHKTHEARVLLCWFPVTVSGTLVLVLAGSREPLDIQGSITVAPARAKSLVPHLFCSNQ